MDDYSSGQCRLDKNSSDTMRVSAADFPLLCGLMIQELLLAWKMVCSFY